MEADTDLANQIIDEWIADGHSALTAEILPPLDWKAAWYALDHDSKTRIEALEAELAEARAKYDEAMNLMRTMLTAIEDQQARQSQVIADARDRAIADLAWALEELRKLEAKP